MFQANGGRTSTTSAAPAPTTAPRPAQMATAQTGSTEMSSAPRAGCMHNGATTVAPRAALPATASCRSVRVSWPSWRAIRSARTAPITAAFAANQPAQTSWAGHWLMAASVKAPVSRTMPKPKARPS